MHLHLFTELFHKIFPHSSEQIAVIPESYIQFIVMSEKKYLWYCFVNKYIKK